MLSEKHFKVKASLDGAKGKLYSVPKATWEQSCISLDVFERWLDEKFVVAAEGVVALLPFFSSLFLQSAGGQRNRELLEHSHGHHWRTMSRRRSCSSA